MQYILSQEEYDKLRSSKSATYADIKSRFIRFVDIAIDECRLRCIYQPIESGLNLMYCDTCPLQDVCPKEKDYSQ